MDIETSGLIKVPLALGAVCGQRCVVRTDMGVLGLLWSVLCLLYGGLVAKVDHKAHTVDKPKDFDLALV